MMPHLRPWSIICAPTITAVILGAALFAPSAAHAECGSYIVYTNPGQQPAESQPMGGHKSPTGCHGPNCSKVPPAPPVPQAPSTLRIRADVMLVISTGDSFVPPSLQCSPIDSTDDKIVRRPSDIYHPPR